MNIDELALILLRGLGQGAIYALLGMSFNTVSNASGILNFANGAIVVLAGLLAYTMLGNDPTTSIWFAMLVGTCVVTLVVAVAQGYLTLKPLKSSVDQHSWLITTMAMSIIIEASIRLYGGAAEFRVPTPFKSISIFGLQTPIAYFLLMGAAASWFGILTIFYRQTFTGLAMSAIAQDLDAAKAAGIKVRSVQLYAFAISGLILATAGFIGGPVINVSSQSGVGYLLSGFTALVIGGLGSNVGALAGGALVGVLSNYAAFEFGGAYQDTVTLGLLVIVLMFKPEGLFGFTSARKV